MSTSSLQTENVSISKTKNISLWVAQGLVAAIFLMAGGSKLMGAEQMVKTYEVIGVGQWFRYVTGIIEVASAIILLVPSLSSLAGVLLACTMVGAIITHLFVIGGNPAMPIVLLAASLYIAWGRKSKMTALKELQE